MCYERVIVYVSKNLKQSILRITRDIHLQLPSVINSTSHYSGVVSLLLYNGQIWGLWDVRDAFSADFTDDLER